MRPNITEAPSRALGTRTNSTINANTAGNRRWCRSVRPPRAKVPFIAFGPGRGHPRVRTEPTAVARCAVSLRSQPNRRTVCPSRAPNRHRPFAAVHALLARPGFMPICAPYSSGTGDARCHSDLRSGRHRGRSTYGAPPRLSWSGAPACSSP